MRETPLLKLVVAWSFIFTSVAGAMVLPELDVNNESAGGSYEELPSTKIIGIEREFSIPENTEDTAVEEEEAEDSGSHVLTDEETLEAESQDTQERPPPDSESDSPEIFFHVKDTITTDVRVDIRDGVTTTIPGVPMGTSAEWTDVKVETDGTITCGDGSYEYLYYEGRFTHRYGESEYGWLVEKRDGRMYLQGEPVDTHGLLTFIAGEMKESGLADNEVRVMLERILEYDMLDFDGPYLVIRYMPTVQVDGAIGLSTSWDFSVMRRHLLIEESSEAVELSEPVYEEVEDTGYVIHETAVNRV